MVLIFFAGIQKAVRITGITNRRRAAVTDMSSSFYGIRLFALQTNLEDMIEDNLKYSAIR
jgi:hypothetical protein